MQANVGTPDRALRLVAVVVLTVLVFALSLGAVIEILLLIVAVVLAVTALVGTCPLYRLFGLSTRPAPQNRV